ncbi:MAG: mechanosensitive ion channel [Gammaproteobacteria bacterium]|nr:mechanosensitive ion channel [Gammaproteobacteria bacterium]
MKQHKSLLLFITILVCLAMGRPLLAVEDSKTTPELQGTVTQNIIESKVAEVEAGTGMDEQTKEKLLLLYRKALVNLETAVSNEQSALAFQRASKDAPATIKQLGKQMDEVNAELDNDTLIRKLPVNLQEIEQLLQQEKAELALQDAKLLDVELRLQEETGRPAIIRQRLPEAKQQLEDVYSELKQLQPTKDDAATSQARRWVLESRVQQLSAEINMLNQELLSQPLRIDQLEAERDRAQAGIRWSTARISALESQVTLKHQGEVNQARLEAEVILDESAGKHPLVVQLAGKNADLSNQIASMVSRLDELTQQTEQVNKRARQIEEDYKRGREIVDIGGLSKGMGHMLLQQHYALPDQNALRRQAEERKDAAAEIGVNRLLHRQDRRRVRDIDAYLDGIMAEVNEQEYPLLRDELNKLAQERLALLEKALESDDFYLQKLGELELAQQRLLGAIDDFNGYLAVHLLWVRSATRAELQALGVVPAQAWRILSPHGWFEVMQVLEYQAVHSAAFVLLVLILGALIWNRKRMITAIQSIGKRLGRPATDNFVLTIKVVLLTLITVAALPLVLAVAGWQLKASSQATVFSIAVGSALLAFATQFFYIRALRMVCMPGGLAAAHFRWPKSSLVLLRHEMDRLSWIYLPAALISFVVFYLDPLNAGWEIGRIAFLVMIVSLAFAFYQLLHPVRGVFAGYMKKSGRNSARRLLLPFYVVLVMAPLALGVLSLTGYLYTAGILLSLLLQTSWLIVGLVILAELAHRWLLVIRRRLVYDAAIKEEVQQDTEVSLQQGTQLEAEEAQVDLVTLSDTSLKLLNTSVLVLGFIGLWMIWHEVFPALRIFENVTLWHHAMMVEGVETQQPVTLLDIAIALIYGIATLVLAKQLPAVLEIILLQSTGMASSSRYTVTTLTTYVIVTFGIVLVFNTLGADWSKLQWLVAALGVGIGFGLQEIVANFISGIIILFERPVRVGDFVTIGETDGFVTKIRIRATTIRSRDAHELLVPNKEFITGRLLNWSLTDQTSRLLITIGIAYGSDVDKAMRLMDEAARQNNNVLDQPSPSVIFQSFGDNALNMILRCFVSSVEYRESTISELNRAINRKFNEAGIVIAFPQRDLHIDASAPLQVRIEGGQQDQAKEDKTP